MSTTEPLTDVLVEARAVAQDDSPVARNWRMESVYVRRLISRPCDEVDELRATIRRLTQEPYDE